MEVRLMERSCSPERRKAITSLRRVSGRIIPGFSV